MFSYAVETERRFYLANQVELTERSDGWVELKLGDAWVWDMFRPARFVSSVRVLTRRDVNVEEPGRTTPSSSPSRRPRSDPPTCVVRRPAPPTACPLRELWLACEGERTPEERGSAFDLGGVACALALLLVVVVGSTAVTAQTSEGFQVVVGVLRPTGSRAPSLLTGRLPETDSSLLDRSSSKLVNVIVKLDYDPLAVYDGSIEGLERDEPQRHRAAARAAARRSAGTPATWRTSRRTRRTRSSRASRRRRSGSRSSSRTGCLRAVAGERG